MKPWTILPLLLFFASSAWGSAPSKRASAPVKSLVRGVSTPLSAKKRKALFEEGNQFYAAGKYQKAIDRFSQLTRDPKWENFSVWYNLGNCHFRLQSYGVALGYYRMAQRLRPNHLHLLHNIQLLLSRVGKSNNRRNVRAKVLFWYYLFNLRQLLLCTGLALLLTLLLGGVTLRKQATAQGQTLRWLTLTAGTLTLLLGLSFGLKWSSERVQRRGVITQSKVSARSGYGRQFESLFLLTEADEVRVLEEVGKWSKVELTLQDDKKGTTRQRGWVPRAALFQIK